MFLSERRSAGQLFRLRLSTETQLKRQLYLASRFICAFPLQSLCKQIRLLQHELTVE